MCRVGWVEFWKNLVGMGARQDICWGTDEQPFTVVLLGVNASDKNVPPFITAPRGHPFIALIRMSGCALSDNNGCGHLLSDHPLWMMSSLQLAFMLFSKNKKSF